MKFVPFFLLVLAVIGGIVTLVVSAQKGHEFARDECSLCHTSTNGNFKKLRADVTTACASCHPSARNYRAHPTDLIPKMPLPGDMLLVNGKFTCVSCHDVHKKSTFSRYYLRRNISGKPFCLICHDVDSKGHLFVGATHTGQFQVEDNRSRLDAVTLLCIECHDDRVDSISSETGAGSWNHFSGRLNHPIGVSYQEAYRKKPKTFVAPMIVPEGITLFDGKIGCGTCHNRYSPHNQMLVMSNVRSKLCFSCHNM